MSASDLLSNGPRVLGVGLTGFIDDLDAQKITAVAVDWRPPATTDPKVLQAAENLSKDKLAENIDKANATALERMMTAEPVLTEVLPASELIEGLADKQILHAGPPIDWKNMCGPMRGAICLSLIHI